MVINPSHTQIITLYTVLRISHSNTRSSSQALQNFSCQRTKVRINPLILQAKQNIYHFFTTLKFCVTPMKSSIDKVVSSSRVFLQQECACFLAGPGACGLWPISSLVNLELILWATDRYSNFDFQLPSILEIHPIVMSSFLLFVPN